MKEGVREEWREGGRKEEGKEGRKERRKEGNHSFSITLLAFSHC
jgi:hypothetical protein